MADGYACSTGKGGHCAGDLGSRRHQLHHGHRDRLHGLHSLVILSGQVPTSMIGEDAFQETDMIGISRPVVKHSFLCKASDIPEAIKKAYYIAASGPGPRGGGSAQRRRIRKRSSPISIPSPFPALLPTRPRPDTGARSSVPPSC